MARYTIVARHARVTTVATAEGRRYYVTVDRDEKVRVGPARLHRWVVRDENGAAVAHGSSLRVELDPLWCMTQVPQ